MYITESSIKEDTLVYTFNGRGISALWFLEVLLPAPPFFLKNLIPKPSCLLFKSGVGFRRPRPLHREPGSRRQVQPTCTHSFLEWLH